MSYKLYVSNLPVDMTETAIRAIFSAHGGVSNVEMLLERSNGMFGGRACVTMTSPSFFASALTLDGTMFEGQKLKVSETPIPAHGRGDKDKPPAPTVKIVQQFRERNNMTYDLDCAGLPLVLRVHSVENGEWRIDARAKDEAESLHATGTATTRRAALVEVVRAWNEAATASGGRRLDGAGLLDAMSGVKAIEPS